MQIRRKGTHRDVICVIMHNRWTGKIECRAWHRTVPDDVQLRTAFRNVVDVRDRYESGRREVRVLRAVPKWNMMRGDHCHLPGGKVRQQGE